MVYEIQNWRLDSLDEMDAVYTVTSLDEMDAVYCVTLRMIPIHMWFAG